MSRQIANLPHALSQNELFLSRLGSRKPAVFLDYDGTLTPIVDRPEDAIITPDMRDSVSTLAARCPVCVVSGRDRKVVQALMGLDNLIVAGSHGFDIWSPDGGTLQREEGSAYMALLGEVKARLQAELGGISGALIEPKKASVAAHYRLVAEAERPKVKAVVDAILAAHPEELKMTPGKMVYEIQPRIDWDKGKAVLYLLSALNLDGDDYMPMYLGDDLTDEHAFAALENRGIGIFVGRADDPEVGGRTTYADFVLNAVPEVGQFLGTLAKS